jgi:hypothetical protein
MTSDDHLPGVDAPWPALRGCGLRALLRRLREGLDRGVMRVTDWRVEGKAS